MLFGLCRIWANFASFFGYLFLIFMGNFTTEIFIIILVGICYTQWFLHLAESCLKNAIVSNFFGDIYIPTFFVMFCSVNSPPWKLFSVSAVMTWSSAKSTLFIISAWLTSIPLAEQIYGELSCGCLPPSHPCEVLCMVFVLVLSYKNNWILLKIQDP